MSSHLPRSMVTSTNADTRWEGPHMGLNPQTQDHEGPSPRLAQSPFLLKYMFRLLNMHSEYTLK